MPSRRWQIWAMAGALASLTAKEGRARCARSTNRTTASYCDSAGTSRPPSGLGQRIDGTRQVISPGTPSGSRLVVSTEVDGFADRSAATSSAQAGHEVLAVVQDEERRAGRRARPPAAERPGAPGTSRAPRAASAARPTAFGSASGASSTHHTPPGCESSASAATARARRVLPTPAEPVSVTNRSPVQQVAHLDDLAPPTDERCELDRAGCGGTASSERSGGNADGRSGWTSCQMCSGRPRSLRRCSPRSASVAPRRETVG